MEWTRLVQSSLQQHSRCHLARRCRARSLPPSAFEVVQLCACRLKNAGATQMSQRSIVTGLETRAQSADSLAIGPRIFTLEGTIGNNHATCTVTTTHSSCCKLSCESLMKTSPASVAPGVRVRASHTRLSTRFPPAGMCCWPCVTLNSHGTLVLAT